MSEIRRSSAIRRSAPFPVALRALAAEGSLVEERLRTIDLPAEHAGCQVSLRRVSRTLATDKHTGAARSTEIDYIHFKLTASYCYYDVIADFMTNQLTVNPTLNRNFTPRERPKTPGEDIHAIATSSALLPQSRPRPVGRGRAQCRAGEPVMAEPFSTLRTDSNNGVMSVTLDHGPVNLMDGQMLRDLRGLLDALEKDSAIKVVVFRSANPEFFICHADLNIFLKDRPTPPKPTGRRNFIHALFEGYRLLPKATIAVIAGRCNGAGTEFATSLDMRFAATGPTFIGQFEVALGALPGGTGTQRLPTLMGRARALELILGCDELDAVTAERYGLVNRAIHPDEIDAFVTALAHRIASFPLDAIAKAKQAVDRGLSDPTPGLVAESLLAGQLMATDEVKRRFAALLARGGQTPLGERQLAQLLPQLGQLAP